MPNVELLAVNRRILQSTGLHILHDALQRYRDGLPPINEDDISILDIVRDFSSQPDEGEQRDEYDEFIHDFDIEDDDIDYTNSNLGEEVVNSLSAGADVVHFDVMDNHYVPNLTIGPMVCSALRKHGVTAPIDVHLMVSPVDRIVGDFADAGASYITCLLYTSPSPRDRG